MSVGRKGFTLVELLVVTTIIAILAIVVIYTLNPGQLFGQAQDASRASGLSSLDKSISLYYSNAINDPKDLSLGSSSVVYISIPDPTATTTAGTNCSGLGLNLLGITYHCAASSTYLKVDGTGWIPINFSSYPAGSPLSALPVDPVNTVANHQYYEYVTDGTNQYEIVATAQTSKYFSDTADFIKGASGLLPGNIWVIDGDNRVEGFSPTGAYEFQFGSTGSGNGQFGYPFDITFDPPGNIWVTDWNNNRVQEFSASGTYESQFGSPGSGNGQFNGPDGIAIDANRNIWVVDANNNRVQEFSPSGAYESQIGGTGSGNGKFIQPHFAFFDQSGNLWVLDAGNSRVQEFSSTGVYESQVDFGYGTGNGAFRNPGPIAFDANGNIWIVDTGNNRVQELSPTGVYESQVGTAGSGNGQFNSPSSIIFDGKGNMWVVDAGNDRVEEFSSTGVYESQFGSNGVGNGQFSAPTAITIYSTLKL